MPGAGNDYPGFVIPLRSRKLPFDCLEQESGIRAGWEMHEFSKLFGRLLAGPTFLDGLGPVALADRRLVMLVLLLMAVVVLPVFVLTPLFAWRYRHTNKATVRKPRRDFSWPLELLIWGVPVTVVCILSVAVWRQTHRLDPYGTTEAGRPVLDIQVVGLDWKWLFLYPDHHIAAVNEMVFPVDRVVHLTLTSDTVMQSFIVPRLAGQIYAMAGMKTHLHLQAHAPGNFLGQNTQYNGDGFSRQRFQARAVTEEEFARWVAQTKDADRPLDAAMYRGLLARSVVADPVFFSSVATGFFEGVIGRHHRSPGARGSHTDHRHD